MAARTSGGSRRGSLPAGWLHPERTTAKPSARNAGTRRNWDLPENMGFSPTTNWSRQDGGDRSWGRRVLIASGRVLEPRTRDACVDASVDPCETRTGEIRLRVEHVARGGSRVREE